MSAIDAVSQFDTLQCSSSKINSKIISVGDKMSNKTFPNYASMGIFRGDGLLERTGNTFVVLQEWGWLWCDGSRQDRPVWC